MLLPSYLDSNPCLAAPAGTAVVPVAAALEAVGAAAAGVEAVAVDVVGESEKGCSDLFVRKSIF